MQIGDKVNYLGHQATITKIHKNGNVALEYWVQSFGMVQPRLWKERSVSPKRLAV